MNHPQFRLTPEERRLDALHARRSEGQRIAAMRREIRALHRDLRDQHRHVEALTHTTIADRAMFEATLAEREARIAFLEARLRESMTALRPELP